MQYQVTCKQCGGKFQLSVDNVRRISSVCPYCGQKLSVVIPQTIAQVPPVMEAYEVKPTVVQPKKKSGVVSKLLFFVFCLSLLGAALWFWNDYQATVKTNELRARQLHRDSVMQVRAAIEAKAKAEKELEKKHILVEQFLRSFYTNAVLSDAEPEYYEHYLTENCRKIVFGNIENQVDMDRKAVWWGAFGSISGLKNKEALVRNLRITYNDADWYKVRLSQDGETEFKLIKIKIDNKKILIDDIR